jgi:hypothetical protein
VTAAAFLCGNRSLLNRLLEVAAVTISVAAKFMTARCSRLRYFWVDSGLIRGPSDFT